MKGKKTCREKLIISRIVKQLSKSSNPELLVSEISKISYQKKNIIDTPEKAAESFSSIKAKKQEHFAMLTLDGARQLINKHVVTIGTLTRTLVHPREVFALAIEDRAASVIIAHNHPSGSLEISSEDRDVTSVMKKAGEIMNIPLDDHLIITENGFVSVPEK